MRYIVHGATYLDPDGNAVVFQGATVSRAVITRNGETVIIPAKEFYDNYTLTDEHDHVNYCCDVHDTHTSPHKGCLLR